MYRISNRALPATRAIHKVLLKELNVESRIGATVGDVYCGIVGGLQRHEYAVLGPSVNLAARLMASPRNPGILVDNAVRLGAGKFFVFNALEPVTAKGYAKLVRIFEPVGLSESKWKKIDFNFVGREVELKLMFSQAQKTPPTAQLELCKPCGIPTRVSIMISFLRSSTKLA